MTKNSRISNDKGDEAMESYWDGVEGTDDLQRGMYIILPLRYDEEVQLGDISVPVGTPAEFFSEDFIELLNSKCSTGGDFVRRFMIDPGKLQISLVNTENCGIPVADIQLFAFSGGIAFLAVYLSYLNKDVSSVYDFILPGYLNEGEKIKKAQMHFLKELEEKLIGRVSPKMDWFISEESYKPFILKEAYRMNVAGLPKRFEETEIAERITYNEHRIIDLSLDFTDNSGKDVAYVSGARDVNLCNYGWGCAITSQEISYAYAIGYKSPIERAQDDLLLTMLVMYQKYTCLHLNEELHQRYVSKANRKNSIRELKHEAMNFIAYGTLAPSQISRWNNVCETYRALIELNGIHETTQEIKEKISLLDEEQERIDSQWENTIGMIIAVFGLISIVASVLQIMDYVSTGSLEMLVSFGVSTGCSLLFGIGLIIMLLRRKKHNGDV